jgi:hypothetical protein
MAGLDYLFMAYISKPLLSSIGGYAVLHTQPMVWVAIHPVLADLLLSEYLLALIMELHIGKLTIDLYPITRLSSGLSRASKSSSDYQ